MIFMILLFDIEKLITPSVTAQTFQCSWSFQLVSFSEMTVPSLNTALCTPTSLAYSHGYSHAHLGHPPPFFNIAFQDFHLKNVACNLQLSYYIVHCANYILQIPSWNLSDCFFQYASWKLHLIIYMFPIISLILHLASLVLQITSCKLRFSN